MKNLIISIVAVFTLVTLTGCCCTSNRGDNICGGIHCNNPKCPIHFVKTTGEGKDVAFKLEILDPYETRWWFGSKIWATRAELYLKLSISNRPGIYWLYPLTVKNCITGSNVITGFTPYTIPEHLNQTITVELLDDDSLTKEQAKVIKESAEAGMGLICDGVNLYAVEKTNIPVIAENTKKELSTLSGDIAKIVVAQINETKFESCGIKDYHLTSGTGAIFFSNPISLTDPKSGRTRCDIRFHLEAKDAE